MDVPDGLRDAIEGAVTRHLARALGDRSLLLTASRFAAAEQRAMRDGQRLLTPVIHRCYPLSEFDTQVLTLEFDGEQHASRVRSALAFGAATAGVLMSSHLPPNRREAIELLSATFNLGIGLVDGICDTDVATGIRLLELVDRGDVVDATRRPRPRGWLRVQLPPELESDPAVSFAVGIIETFFATLHATYPGDAWARLRARVGDQLAVALEAERSSLAASPADASPDQLTHYSYATSVTPFEIVGTLSLGDHAAAVARFLGEAMWRLDDLVDLCDDAQSGALNAVLLGATGSGREALERLLVTDVIAAAAARAGDSLLRGVELAARPAQDGSVDVFLQFIARYAGILPEQRS